MNYFPRFQYLIWGFCFWIIASNIWLQAQTQCNILTDFRNSEVPPNVCGAIGIFSNDLLQFQVNAIEDQQYICDSEAPSCTHAATSEGWILENSVLSVDFSALRNVESIHLDFLDFIGKEDVEIRVLEGEKLLANITESDGTSISIQELEFLNQATHLQIMVCGARLSMLSFTYDCLDSSESGVWPGDANNDGVANNFDLLSIGLSYGNMGIPRTEASLDWKAQDAADWETAFGSGVNHKYADCNGDGMILSDDIEGIVQNYNLIQVKSEGGGESGNANDPPLYVDIPDEPLNEGDELIAPIILGTATNPVIDIYAIAFTISFDDELLDVSTINVDFTECWLGTKDVNLITLVHVYPDSGTIDVSITRTDMESQTGYGIIGTMTGVIDNIAGKSEVKNFEIKVENVKAISSTEVPVDVFPTTDSGTATDIEYELISQSIQLYPNPANSFTFLQVPEQHKIQSIELFNAVGKLEEILTPIQNSGDALQLELSPLQSGVYFIKIQYDGNLITRKLWILKE